MHVAAALRAPLASWQMCRRLLLLCAAVAASCVRLAARKVASFSGASKATSACRQLERYWVWQSIDCTELAGGRPTAHALVRDGLKSCNTYTSATRVRRACAALQFRPGAHLIARCGVARPQVHDSCGGARRVPMTL